MRILVISSLLLFKETRYGGAKRLYSFVYDLSRFADVHTICLDASGEAPDFEKSGECLQNFLFLPQCHPPLPAPYKFFYSPIDFQQLVRKNRLSIDRFLNNRPFDAVLLAYPLALSFLCIPQIQAINRAVYLEDDLILETLRNTASGQRSIVLKFLKKIRYWQTFRFYRKALKHITAWIAISSQEQEIIKSYFPAATVSVLKYGVDLEEYPLLPLSPAAKRIGFIGNFLHAPNADAMHHFLGAIFPFLAESMPDLELIIGGKNIPDAIRNHNPSKGKIECIEDFPDIADFYRSITVFVNPIVSRRGLRTKLIEAAAFGRPIISTPLGAEGLEDLMILKAESKKEYRDHLNALFTDQILAESIRMRNRRQIENVYTGSALAKRLFSILTAPTADAE